MRSVALISLSFWVVGKEVFSFERYGIFKDKNTFNPFLNGVKLLFFSLLSFLFFL